VSLLLAEPEVLGADAGTFSVSGQAVTFARAYTLVAAFAAFSASGQDANLRVGWTLAGEAGAYTASGQSAALPVARFIGAAAASFAISGQDAASTVTVPTRLTAGFGAFAASGQSASLRRLVPTRIALESVGTYSAVLTASDVSLAVSLPLYETSRSAALASRDETISVPIDAASQTLTTC